MELRQIRYFVVLAEELIDIGVITMPVNSNKIEVLPFKKVRFMAALPEQHPLASKEPLFIRDMADEIFIITPKSAGPLYYEMFMSVFQNANFTPNIMIQAHDLQTVLALVAGGMGVSLTPSPINPFSGIIKRKVEDINLAIQASLAWRKDNRSKILDQFLTFFAELQHSVIESSELLEHKTSGTPPDWCSLQQRAFFHHGFFLPIFPPQEMFLCEP